MKFVVKGKYIILNTTDKHNCIVNDGALLVSEGKITEVDNYRKLKIKYPNIKVLGNGNQLLLPGLIDAHSHGGGLSFFQKGIPYDFLENNLIDWADAFDIDPELDAMLSAVRHLRNGCTTVHCNYSGGLNGLDNEEKMIKGFREVGIRLAFSLSGRDINRLALNDVEFIKNLPSKLQSFAKKIVYFDRETFIEDYFGRFELLHDKYTNDDVRILFGPSWAAGSTDSFLQKVKKQADELNKLQIHMHTLQTPIQKAYAFKKWGKSQIAHLEDIGLLDENLTLGHAVFLTESDINLLAKNQVSTTHHPNCNLVMRNGISPVYFLLKSGINVALGIDDKGFNDDDDPFTELRLIHRLHRVSNFDLTNIPALDGFDVLKMGTINAARVCGFGGEIGSLKPGMKADMILIDLERIMNDPYMSPQVNIIDILINRANGRDVNTVIVNGEIIIEDKKFCTIDIDYLFKEIRKQASKRYNDKRNRDAEMLKKIKPYYQNWYSDWVKNDFYPFYSINSRK
jgi:cytosine/adenosine deaminase-related metal-dependent hydrolase